MEIFDRYKNPVVIAFRVGIITSRILIITPWLFVNLLILTDKLTELTQGDFSGTLPKRWVSEARIKAILAHLLPK